MKACPFRVLFVVALLFSILTVACGGGSGELTLGEYFKRVAALEDDAATRFGELVLSSSGVPEEGDEFPSEAEQVESLLDFLDAYRPIIRDLVAALDDIDPPAAVEDLHNEFVDAVRNNLVLLERGLKESAGAQSFSELEDDPESLAATERTGAACFALQESAADHGIDVDLGCED